MDQHVEMRREFVEARHGAAGFVEGIKQHSPAAAFEKGEQLAERASDFLRVLPVEDQPPFFAARGLRLDERKEAVCAGDQGGEEFQGGVTHRRESPSVFSVPVAIKPRHPDKRSIRWVGDTRADVQRR